MVRYLRASLTTHGYGVLEACTAREAEDVVAVHRPDVILLDLGLPDRDGLQLARTLRESCSAPIIVISARGQEEDKIQALDAGADDYLTLWHRRTPGPHPGGPSAWGPRAGPGRGAHFRAGAVEAGSCASGADGSWPAGPPYPQRIQAPGHAGGQCR
ncbi:response regulator [Holophaga foetida]|uniref:response regulator n=1 Tax=Holophaga foetida TaxID=35839 RepID=UPI003CC75268